MKENEEVAVGTWRVEAKSKRKCWNRARAMVQQTGAQVSHTQLKC